MDIDLPTQLKDMGMRYTLLKWAFISLMSVGVASAAMAQLDTGPDGIGLYTDLEATINRSDDVLVINPLYLLATNVTCEAGIQEWGLSLRSSDPMTHIILSSPTSEASDWQCSEGVVDVVGHYHSQPIPAGSIVHLATLLLVRFPYMESADIYIEGPHCAVSGRDHPYYIGYESSQEVRELTPSSGSMSEPVFRINGAAPVATDATSWSSIKTLYR